jgi:hypothetical protein
LSPLLSILSCGLPASFDAYIELVLKRTEADPNPVTSALYFSASFYRDSSAAVAGLVRRLNALDAAHQRRLVEVLLPRLFGDSILDRDRHLLTRRSDRLIRLNQGRTRSPRT